MRVWDCVYAGVQASALQALHSTGKAAQKVRIQIDAFIFRSLQEKKQLLPLFLL